MIPWTLRGSGLASLRNGPGCCVEFCPSELGTREAADLPRCLAPRSCQNVLTGFFGRCDRLRDLLDEMQSAVCICSTERTLGQDQRVGFLLDCQFMGRRTPSPTGHFLGRSFLSVPAM